MVTTLTPEVQNWVNNWIAKEPGPQNLGTQVREMAENPYWQQNIEEYKAIQQAKGYSMGKNDEGVQWDISKSHTHQHLTRIHNEAYQRAFQAWKLENPNAQYNKAYQEQVNKYLQSGQTSKAAQSAAVTEQRKRQQKEVNTVLEFQKR